MLEENQVGRAETAGEGSHGDYIFALDIGTRSVIGIVGVPEGEKLRVSAVETVEHTQRAMIDGQIEDIGQVSRVARLVRQRLEEKTGLVLRHVCVAAAGRALKTQQASYELSLKEPQVVNQELLCQLEAGAIEAAERQFHPETAEQGQPVFYLVGYSVVQYTLDDYPISNLLDHRGQRLGVKVIATFLPREVVDSLYTTMRKTGLEVSSLTLEPIAAMNAAIPRNLRLLNLALVDIGAGTSDIAVSRDGGVVGYTMATVAGDEVTEAIMKEYLVDFATAEQMKMKLSGEDGISFRDILGLEHTVSAKELQGKTEPVMRRLCEEITGRILEANGEPPSAVFLVGGGSKLPGLCECVAELLRLPPSRVALGGNNFMTYVDAPGMELTGPEMATPLGIAVSSALNLINDSFSITLNGKKANLFRSGSLTILDVLLMNGYSYQQMISRSGKSMIVELNGENRVVYGGHPRLARILLNGAESSLSTLVHAGDAIVFEPAAPGEDARPVLEDLVKPEPRGTAFLFGRPVPLGTRAVVNGRPAAPGQRLMARDKVRTVFVGTLGELLASCGEPRERACLINGSPGRPDDKLADGDRIEAAPEGVGLPAGVEPGSPAGAEEKQIPAAPPEKPSPHPGRIRLTLNHAGLELGPKPDKTPYCLIDMLNLVDVDLSKPQGNIVLHINGRNASYLQPLADGDKVDIYWDGADAPTKP